MVRLEIYKQFQVEHVVPRYEYKDQQAMKEESKRFRVVDDEFIDKATIGLRLQQFIAEEHLRDLVEIEKLQQQQAEAESKQLVRDIVSRIGRMRKFPVKNGAELGRHAEVPSNSVKTGVEIGVVSSSN